MIATVFPGSLLAPPLLTELRRCDLRTTASGEDCLRLIRIPMKRSALQVTHVSLVTFRNEATRAADLIVAAHTVSPRLDVVVDVAETGAGTALSAFKSWIPAGTVGRYVWTWVTPDAKNPNLPWTGTQEERSEPHRFIFSLLTPTLGTARPRRIAQQVCMRVEGLQLGSVSGVEGVEGGSTCSVGGPPLPNMPAWWVNLMLPIWGRLGRTRYSATRSRRTSAHDSRRAVPPIPTPRASSTLRGNHPWRRCRS